LRDEGHNAAGLGVVGSV